MSNILKKGLPFLLIVLTFSCSNEEKNSVKKPEKAFDLEKITEEYNNFHSSNPAAYYEGKVSFRISDGKVIMLIGEDGNYKTSFTIQMEEINKQHFDELNAGQYQIAYLEKDLIFSSPEKTFYFAIDGKQGYEDIAADAINFQVYGIAKWHNDEFTKSSSMVMAFKNAEEGASCTCESVYEPEKDCQSGGKGAISCSQGDCSVTCGSENYACCNEA